MTGFEALGVNQSISEKLSEMGITVPTEVQAATIPAFLEGKNLVVQSPTGSGKTLAYLAPVLTRLEAGKRDLEAIILLPSRELAVQVLQVIREIAGEVSAVSLIGGVNPTRQVETLKKEKPQIAVGTPGRVLELLGKRKINGQVVQTIVVDEADKMLSQGFMADVRGILKATLKTRQVAFFSATIPRELLEEIPGTESEPVFLDLSSTGKTPPGLRHLYFTCNRQQKTQCLVELLSIYQPVRAIVFIQTNEGVEPLSARLREKGISSLALHSDLPQPQRREILRKFRGGKGDVLVTTDLLARGMDISEVDFVFNYDLPRDAKHYLHRAGRTGRAGREGTVITLVPEEQKSLIPRMAKELKVKFTLMGMANGRVFPVKLSCRAMEIRQKAAGCLAGLRKNPQSSGKKRRK